MRDPGPLPFWASAAGAVALVGALIAWGRPPLPGTGFEHRVFASADCTGASEVEVVREPFVRHEEHGAGRCEQWSSQLVARGRMRARVEVTSAPGASVSIDGRAVVADEEAHAVRTASGVVDLARGVHTFVVEHRGEGAAPGESPGPEYLRVAMVDERAPHNGEFAPPLDRDLFYPSADEASRALERDLTSADPLLALFAALGLAAAVVCGWLAVRRARGKSTPRLDLALGGVLFVLALVVRARGLAAQDVGPDELLSIDAAAHWARNLTLGDFQPEAWRFDAVHLPNAKWLLALGAGFAGQAGARWVGACASALAVGLLFAFGRLAFGRGVGAVAALLAAVLPLGVGLGRIAGPAASEALWGMASMVALACWLRSPRRAEGAAEPLDPRAAFACVFAATVAALSRATMGWLFVPIGVAQLARSRRELRRGVVAVPVAAAVGGIAALAITLAAWPYVGGHPADALATFAGELRADKHAFPANTPVWLLGLAFVGSLAALAKAAWRWWGLLVLLWAALGDVASAAPAVMVLAAVALVALGDGIANLMLVVSPGLRSAIRFTPAALGVAALAVTLARLEPYPVSPVDASGATWGEGNLAAIRALNASAARGAGVHVALEPARALPRLREDLVPMQDPALADYLVAPHSPRPEKTPPGCALEASVRAANAPLVDTFRCSQASPIQLGFAAMHDPSRIDEAIRHFQDALTLDPHDPAATFGLGWAAQTKGDALRAEQLYLDAASGAARTHDADTEYFARFDLGTLYAERGQHEAAVNAFRSALVVTDQAPEKFEATVWHVWQNLGNALVATGHPDEARTALAHALALQPGEPSLVAALAVLSTPPPTPIADAGAAPRARAAATSSAPRGAPPRR
ncbi:MAG TPA: tetratricopeptide repeat protein [Polyangiaceae bacterium]